MRTAARAQRVFLLHAFLAALTCAGVVPAEHIYAQGRAPCPVVTGWSRVPGPSQLVTAAPGDRDGFTASERLLAVAAGLAPGEVYAGGRYGVYRTADCGRTWQRFLRPLEVGSPSRTSDSVGVLAVGPDGTLYVGDDTALMVSSDRGATWQALGSLNARSLAPSRAAPGLVYAIFDFVSLRGLPGIARSTDAGQTWERTRTGVTAGVVSADVNDAATVYLGLAGCAQSTPTGCARLNGRLEVSRDAGATSVPVATFSSQITGIAQGLDGARMWVSTEDGALHVSRDRGRVWEALANVPYPGHLVSLSASQVGPHQVFGATDQGELWMYSEPIALGLPHAGAGPGDDQQDAAP